MYNKMKEIFWEIRTSKLLFHFKDLLYSYSMMKGSCGAVCAAVVASTIINNSKNEGKIKIVCKLCKRTGLRINEEELKKDNKCRKCGGEIEKV